MKKHILGLSVILALLALAIFFYPDPLDKKLTPQDAPLLNFAKDAVATIQINNFLQGVELQKQGEAWTVRRVVNELAKSVRDKDPTAPVSAEDAQGRPADPVKVATLLGKLFALQAGVPVASERASARTFQINDHSLHAIFYDAGHKELGRLYIGKQADYAATFVRRNTEDDVYLVRENLAGLLLYPYEEWLIDEASSQTEQTGKHGQENGEKPEIRKTRKTR